MKKAVLLLFILSISSSYIQGQNSEAVTFERAVELTFSQNHQISIDKFDHQISIWEKKEAAALRSPSFDLTAGYTFMQKDIGFDLNGLKSPVGNILGSLPPALIPPDIMQQIGGLMKGNWMLKIQDRQTAVVGATGTMPIFTGGKINIANRVARLGITQSDIESIQNNCALFSELVERYFGLSLAMQVVEVRKLVVEGVQKHLDDAIRLEQQGLIAKVERLYAQMKLAEVTAELKKAEANVETIKTALAATITIDYNVLPLSSLFVITDYKSLDYYTQKAIENNPQLRIARIMKNKAEEAIKFERSNYYPQLAAMGGANLYSWQLTGLVPKWAVGAGLKFNIFNGASREFKVAKAKTTVNKIEAITQKGETDILALVKKQYKELGDALDNIEANNATLEFASEYRRVKEIAFNEGTATSTDVVDAIISQSVARISKVSNAYEFDKGLAALLQTCGDSFAFVDMFRSKGYEQIKY